MLVAQSRVARENTLYWSLSACGDADTTAVMDDGRGGKEGRRRGCGWTARWGRRYRQQKT